METAARAVHRSDRVDVGAGVIPAVAVSFAVLDVARALPPPVLRSVDAVHLATAKLAGENLDHLVTYDKRMLAAADAVGIRTAAPS